MRGDSGGSDPRLAVTKPEGLFIHKFDASFFLAESGCALCQLVGKLDRIDDISSLADLLPVPRDRPATTGLLLDKVGSTAIVHDESTPAVLISRDNSGVRGTSYIGCLRGDPSSGGHGHSTIDKVHCDFTEASDGAAPTSTFPHGPQKKGPLRGPF